MFQIYSSIVYLASVNHTVYEMLTQLPPLLDDETRNTLQSAANITAGYDMDADGLLPLKLQVTT